MPGIDGLELIRRIRAQGISLPIWVMTGYGSFDTCLDCARLGVSGYLSKPFLMTALSDLIEETLTSTFDAIPLRASPLASRKAKSSSKEHQLTPREKEVLRYMRHGLTDAEIAQELFVSNHTVHNHVKHIVGKLEVKNRVEAVSLSFQSDLF
jgi:two-component system response regulator FixJ